MEITKMYMYLDAILLISTVILLALLLKKIHKKIKIINIIICMQGTPEVISSILIGSFLVGILPYGCFLV